MRELPPICILAGGLGTRLGTLVDATPKPLLEVAGEPFLCHQLRLLARHGASRAVLCVGYRGELIEERLGGRQFGIELVYSHDGPGLDGTLGAVRRALPLLPERFLVLYGDTYLQLDYRAVDETWAGSGLPALMTVLQNNGRWDTSNAVCVGGRIVAYSKEQPTREMKWIDYGLGGIHASCLDLVAPEERDLALLYSVLAERNQLCGYEAHQRFHEIGTPEALAETDRFLRCLNGTWR